MPTATLSSKYQITIPMEIVRSLGLKPGDKLAVERVEHLFEGFDVAVNWRWQAVANEYLDRDGCE